jgi:hypothetical protein
MDKLKKLLNVKAWFEDVIFTKVAAKGTKYAVAAGVALLAGPKVAPAVQVLQPVFKELGITPEQFVTVVITFALGALFNWAKRVMEKGEPAAVPVVVTPAP